MLHTHFAALALAAVTLIASGCGSSSKTAVTTTAATTPTTTPTTTTGPTVAVVKLASGKPLTRAQWLAQGEDICTRLNTQLAANTVKTNAEFAIVLPQAAAYEHAELEQLVKLVPPASKAKDWQEFLTETQQWAENSAALGRLAQAGKFTLTVPLVATTRKLHEHLAHLAAHEGFKKECSLV